MANFSRDNTLQNPELALHLAAHKNDIIKLRALISENCDLERGSSYGTALHVAITSDQPDAVRILLDAGADSEKPPDCSSYECENSLVLAAIWGKRAIVKILWDHGVAHDLPSVHKPSLNHLSNQRKSAKIRLSALSQAALQGFDGIVSDLCAWRAMDADEMDAALFLGAVRWEDGVIQALLQGGKATQDGLDEALLRAASHRIMLTERGLAAVDMRPQKQGKVIELLLDAGARINIQQPVSGNTALHISASSPDTVGAVRVLLERGADVHIRNKKGETAIAGAMVKQRRPPFKQPREIYNTDAIMMLLQHGASVFVTDNFGQTPMHILAYYGTYSLFQRCLDYYSNPNIFVTTLYGETLLHRAANGNQVEIVEGLLADGACINETSSSGWTALIFALSETLGGVEMLQVVNLLLDHGAKATDTTEEGWTALHRVADISDRYHERVTALIDRLISLGADTEARAVVPGNIDNYRPVGYHLKLSLQEQPPIASEQTPLHWAASNGSVAVVEALLRHGANPVARDSANSTPALCAAYAQPVYGREYSIAKRQQVIKLLLTHGAGYEDEDANGRGVYGWAAVNGLPLWWPEW
ncbi:hypothetical protein MferCBS31731_005245 [Microsporum ferrugineum]